MNERRVYLTKTIDGTTTADVAWQWEFDMPMRLINVKAAASNDSSATLGVTAEGGTTVVTAAAIGDTYSAVELTPVSNAVSMIAADTYVLFSLDYDGSSGTAADNVGVVACFLIGEGA
jgi:hypothetical protein